VNTDSRRRRGANQNNYQGNYNTAHHSNPRPRRSFRSSESFYICLGLLQFARQSDNRAIAPFCVQFAANSTILFPIQPRVGNRFALALGKTLHLSNV
jgi:hypothetical protein